MDRRKFLETGLKSFAALSLYSLTSCSTTPTPEIEPSSYAYPQLPEGKIQPPQKGCWVGFHPFNPGYPDYYLYKIGKHPKLFVPRWTHMSTSNTFVEDRVNDISDTGSIPVIRWPPSFIHGDLHDLPSSRKFRENVKTYARDIVKCNKKLFFTTMIEMNTSVWGWGQQPESFKKVWRLMHNIFRDEGANELTTWFWEIVPPIYGAWSRNLTDSPARYWPGNEYVDYIGISAYSRDGLATDNESLYSRAKSTIHNLHDRYPDKPIIISEFGKTKSSSQVYWIKDAFQYIKEEPIIKGAIYWDSVLMLEDIEDDHTLHESSFKYLKNLFKNDPYFIFADYQSNI